MPAEHATCNEQIRNTQNILVGKINEYLYRGEDNIKIVITEIALSYGVDPSGHGGGPIKENFWV